MSHDHEVLVVTRTELLQSARTGETLLVGSDQVFLLERANQGPPGPGGTGSLEAATATDFTDSRYWYVRYPSRIKRLDHAVSPPTVAFAVGDWDDRLTLTYT